MYNNLHINVSKNNSVRYMLYKFPNTEISNTNLIL